MPANLPPALAALVPENDHRETCVCSECGTRATIVATLRAVATTEELGWANAIEGKSDHGH